MSIISQLSIAASILTTTFVLIGFGIHISGLGYISYSTNRWLSRYTSVEDPDPTEFQRVWSSFYYSNIHPFGEKAVGQHRSTDVNGVFYILTIGFVMMSAVTGLYYTISTAVLGTSIAAYYATGFILEVTSVFELVAAFCVLLFITTMTHATEEASKNL